MFFVFFNRLRIVVIGFHDIKQTFINLLIGFLFLLRKLLLLLMFMLCLLVMFFLNRSKGLWFLLLTLSNSIFGSYNLSHLFLQALYLLLKTLNFLFTLFLLLCRFLNHLSLLLVISTILIFLKLIDLLFHTKLHHFLNFTLKFRILHLLPFINFHFILEVFFNQFFFLWSLEIVFWPLVLVNIEIKCCNIS